MGKYIQLCAHVFVYYCAFVCVHGCMSVTHHVRMCVNTYICWLPCVCAYVCPLSYSHASFFHIYIYIILHTCLENLFISTCLGLSPFLFFLGGSENCFLSSSLVEKAGRQPYGRRPGQKTFWYRCEREVPSKC